MAVVAKPLDSVLQISLQVGTDTAGRPVIRKRIFANLNSALTDQQVYDLSTVLAGLQSFPVTGTLRLNNVDLANSLV